MNRRLIVALLFVGATLLIGCGKEEDTKPPEGSTYYQGEMKPKGPNNAAGGGLPEGG